MLVGTYLQTLFQYRFLQLRIDGFYQCYVFYDLLFVHQSINPSFITPDSPDGTVDML
jgi:hypothetical protein